METFKENGTQNVRHAWSIFCASSVIDQETNNISINTVIEQLTLDLSRTASQGRERQDGIFLQGQFQVVTKLIKKVKAKDIAVELKINIENPNNDVIVEGDPNKYGMKKGIRNFRVRTNLSRIPIQTSKPGMYTFVIQLREAGDGEFVEVDRVPFEVRINP